MIRESSDVKGFGVGEGPRGWGGRRGEPSAAARAATCRLPPLASPLAVEAGLAPHLRPLGPQLDPGAGRSPKAVLAPGQRQGCAQDQPKTQRRVPLRLQQPLVHPRPEVHPQPHPTGPDGAEEGEVL